MEMKIVPKCGVVLVKFKLEMNASWQMTKHEAPTTGIFDDCNFQVIMRFTA